MDETNESEYQAWQKDVRFLVDTLQSLFEAESSRFYLDEVNNRLYVEIEGIDELDEEEIAEIAEPLLSELDLDFEDIVLLPLTS